MSLFQHLAELRTRLLISLVSITVTSIVGYFFTPWLYHLLSEPFFKAFASAQLIGTGPAEAFVLKLKMAVFAGILLATPIMFHQLWLFVKPGLLEQEKKFVLPFVLSTSGLFFIGVTFCYYAVFPFAFAFFSDQYQSLGLSPTIRISEHLQLMIQGMVAFGVMFEMPMIFTVLAYLGVVTSKQLIGSIRHAIVIIFIVAAILTPPDVLTQFLLAGPLCILYGISILLVRSVERRRPTSKL